MYEYIRVKDKHGVEFDAVSNDPRIGHELQPLNSKAWPNATQPRPEKQPQEPKTKETSNGSNNQ